MSTGEQSLFFLFNVNSPSTGIRFYFWQIKSLFHGPTFWLQKTESGCIVLSQKNSGNRSCTYANNETANNSSMIDDSLWQCTVYSVKPLPRTSCVDIMIQKGNVGQVGNSSTRATGYIVCAEKSGCELFRPQGLLKMADDRTGSVRDVCFEVLSQSMPIDERFLCGYRLIIDWPIPEQSKTPRPH